MTEITPATPLQQRAAELYRLFATCTFAQWTQAEQWTLQAQKATGYSIGPTQAASLLLAAIEAEQEPDEDKPLLWHTWLEQAERDGIPFSEAVRLGVSATHISRQIYHTP